jgi:hypothetical protein
VEERNAFENQRVEGVEAWEEAEAVQSAVSFLVGKGEQGEAVQAS